MKIENQKLFIERLKSTSVLSEEDKRFIIEQVEFMSLDDVNRILDIIENYERKMIIDDMSLKEGLDDKIIQAQVQNLISFL